MKDQPNICPVCKQETGTDYFVVPYDVNGKIGNLYPHKFCAPELRQQLGILWVFPAGSTEANDEPDRGIDLSLNSV